jgi:3-hydroxyisobutyrate dehydrogenase
MHVGFIGLGNMGAPLARRLCTDHTLWVFDQSQTAVDTLSGVDAQVAKSAAELAESVDIVLTCLPTSEDLRSLLFGDQQVASVLKAGTMLIDMTTGDPGVTRDLAAKLAMDGIDLIDAPVSGGPKGATAGTIAIIVGGSAAQFSRALPVLSAISSNVMHAGDVGAGHAVKAGNNLLNLVCRLATFEVVSLLVRAGVTPENAVAIIQKGSGRNYATEITLPDNILSGTLHQGFTMGLMHKDSSVALQMAADLNVPLPISTTAFANLKQAMNEHGQESDMSAVALTYEKNLGARIRP